MSQNTSFKNLDERIGEIVIDAILEERVSFIKSRPEEPKSINVPRKYFRFLGAWFNRQILYATNPEKGEEKTIFGMKVNVIEGEDFNLK
jgi:hypothetical protein